MRLPCGPQEDPIVKALRRTFRAQPVRVPEARILPMAVLAAGGDDEAIWRGELEHLIEGEFSYPQKLIHRDDVSATFAQTSREISGEVALKLLDGFASSLGMTGALPSIGAAAQSARSVQLGFPRVTRRYVDIGEVARLLAKRRLVRNAATEIFLRPKAPMRMLLIDSVLRSATFTLRLNRGSGGKTSVDIGAIRKLVGDVKVEVGAETAEATELSFAGPEQLTFAFSCKQIVLAPHGKIASFDETRAGAFLGAEEEPPKASPPSADLRPGKVESLDVLAELTDDEQS
jgi:hypothetical protein